MRREGSLAASFFGALVALREPLQVVVLRQPLKMSSMFERAVLHHLDVCLRQAHS